MSVAETRSFFQCLQYVTLGGGVVIHVHQAGESEMHVCRVGGVEQEQFLIRVDGGLGFAEFFAGGGEKSVGLGQQRIHGEEPLGILRDRFPVLRAFSQAS